MPLAAAPDACRAMLRRLALILAAALMAACSSPASRAPNPAPLPLPVPGYGEIEDGGFVIAAVPEQYVPPENRAADVAYPGPEAPGTIVIDPFSKYLYLVGESGTARRYRIAVGEEGRGFRGTAYVGRKAQWPYWAPTRNMIRTQPELYADLAGGMQPGPDNPLGARALYLYRNGRDTMFRIHGTGDYTSIGRETTAGCIRLYNQDIIDLYERVAPGQRVRVRTLEESIRLEGLPPGTA